MRIENASPDEAHEIAAIYALHVLRGTATFETVPPDSGEMAARIGRVLASGGVWLVARDPAGAMLGYAYVSQFRDRAAYRFAAEDSIYIRDDARGQGVGKALLAALLAAAEAVQFRQMFAVIGGAEPASIALHRALGFVEVGRLRAIGRKFGRWLDTVYMQRPIGPDAAGAPPFEPG